MEHQKHDRWDINNIKAVVRMAYEAGMLQVQNTPTGMGCRYENANGHRCAVGQLFLESEIREIVASGWNRFGITDNASSVLGCYLKAKGCSRKSLAFLEQLQLAHDCWMKYGSELYEPRFKKLIGIEETVDA